MYQWNKNILSFSLPFTKKDHHRRLADLEVLRDQLVTQTTFRDLLFVVWRFDQSLRSSSKRDRIASITGRRRGLAGRLKAGSETSMYFLTVLRITPCSVETLR